VDNDFDIAIVGGGLAGATLACALSAMRFHVALLEARPLRTVDQLDDARSLALGFGSRRILSGLDLWPALASVATPIKTIHISQRGRFGATRLNADEEGVEALGYIVRKHDLGRAAYARLTSQSNVQVIAPARLQDIAFEASGASVTFVCQPEGQKESEAALRCQLLIGADGMDSDTRRRLNIGAAITDYGQTAVVTSVTSSRHHAFRAYERFTDTGPLALLPMEDNRCSLIWTHAPGGAQSVMRLSDAEFLDALQTRFGYRLGRFREVGARQMYPLKLSVADEWIGPRAALIGNAAHTLHPIAGQGFNLALRDVAQLVELLSHPSNGNPGDPKMLARYARLRRADLRRTVRFTDSLARVFMNPWAPVAYGRAAGLLALDLLSPLRHRLAQQAMGLSARAPRLTSGLALANLH
jgi:2-octaprenyl-6-methoxyphenol hydroxylase